MLPSEAFEIGRSLPKSRYEVEAFWKTYELSIDGNIKYISNSFKKYTNLATT
jgi:hypothetical protein